MEHTRHPSEKQTMVHVSPDEQHNIRPRTDASFRVDLAKQPIRSALRASTTPLGRIFATLILSVALLAGCIILMPEASANAEQMSTDSNESTINQTEPQVITTPVSLPTSAPLDIELPTVEPQAAPQTGSAEAESAVGGTDFSRLVSMQADAFGYNGQVFAQNRVEVIAQANGLVLGVQVQVGDVVRAGDPLVQLDNTISEAQRAQAMAGLLAAQAQLESILEPAKQADVAAAQASIAAAEASYQRTLSGPSSEALRGAEVQLRQAQAAVDVATSAYNEVRWRPDVGALPQSLQLQQTTLALEGAQAAFDEVQRGNTADVIANANAQLLNARSQLERLLEGADTAQIRSAQAQISQAETSLYLAQLQLDRATVRAPIDGIISQMQTSLGTTVGSGTSVATLISKDVKIVIAVEDFRLSELQIGQMAEIRVDAFPDEMITGQVTLIAPELNPATRSIDVTILPTSDNARLLAPGMFAAVDLLDQE